MSLLNKAPRNDSLPTEFYVPFWYLLWEKEEISPSQKQALITLIDKKDQNCYLQNWRPISLVNVNTKIASKVIAERMKSLLPKLIRYKQSGYIPCRKKYQ